MPLLEVNNVSWVRDQNRILDNISFTLEKGKIITVIGPNGAGKTSLIRVILGLQKPTSGKIKIRAGARLGYMPQKLMIDYSLPLKVKHFLRLADKDQENALRALDLVGVPHLLNHSMAHLSGGETQRVLLARAMMRQPDLLVLDEPVQGVDVSGQEALYSLIASIRANTDCAVLMISHDLHLVMAASDEVLCLNHHVCCHGTPDKVSADPAYSELFGVRTALYTHDHDHEHSLHGEIEHSHGACQHD
jgi:zinc transport system ATP-binding protein